MMKREQRQALDLINSLDLGFAERVAAKDAIASSVENAETAYLMQEAVPELTDISSESKGPWRCMASTTRLPKWMNMPVNV